MVVVWKILVHWVVQMSKHFITHIKEILLANITSDLIRKVQVLGGHAAGGGCDVGGCVVVSHCGCNAPCPRGWRRAPAQVPSCECSHRSPRFTACLSSYCWVWPGRCLHQMCELPCFLPVCREFPFIPCPPPPSGLQPLVYIGPWLNWFSFSQNFSCFHLGRLLCCCCKLTVFLLQSPLCCCSVRSFTSNGSEPALLPPSPVSLYSALSSALLGTWNIYYCKVFGSRVNSRCPYWSILLFVMVHIFLLCRSAIIYWIPDTVNVLGYQVMESVCVFLSILLSFLLGWG